MVFGAISTPKDGNAYVRFPPFKEESFLSRMAKKIGMVFANNTPPIVKTALDPETLIITARSDKEKLTSFDRVLSLLNS